MSAFPFPLSYNKIAPFLCWYWQFQGLFPASLWELLHSKTESCFTGKNPLNPTESSYSTRYPKLCVDSKVSPCSLGSTLTPVCSPQISYSGLRSFDPSVPLQRPGLTASLPSNASHHLFSQLHPGVTYQLSIRASTSKGFGPATTLNVTTNISGLSRSTVPHYENICFTRSVVNNTSFLSPAPTIEEYDGSEAFLNETATTITVLLKPAQAKGAPIRYCRNGVQISTTLQFSNRYMHRQDVIQVLRTAPCCRVLFSAYQIVVEEVNPQRTRRQASSDCYEVIKNLHFTAAASQEINDIQPSPSATGSRFVP